MKQSIVDEILDFEPSTLITLFRLSLTKKVRGNNYYFHNGENGYRQSIFYGEGGGRNEYFHIPFSVNGFDYADNEFPRPTLIFDNSDGFFSLKTRFFDDFIGYEIFRIRTFVKFLSNNNFPNNLNPFGTGNEDSFPIEKYIINKKTHENASSIAFELSSPLEKENSFLPNRKIVYNTCQWRYRHHIGCGYDGPPKTDSKGNAIHFPDDTTIVRGNPFIFDPEATYDKGQYVLILDETQPNLAPKFYVCLKNGTVGIDPETNKSNWVEDACAKNLKGCRTRFGDSEVDNGLPFGGFPGSWKY